MVENSVNMNQEPENRKMVEVDGVRLWNALRRHLWAVILAAVIGAVISFSVTYLFVTPQYEASAMFYVNNSDLSFGDASISIGSGDITASKSLVTTYITILKTRSTMNDVIDYADSHRDFEDMMEMVTAAAVNETEIFRVTVTSSDPGEAETLANAIAHIIPKKIGDVVEGSSVKVVDFAVRPTSPSSPSYPVMTVLGFLLGMVLVAGIILLVELFDVTIKEEEDLQRCCRYPMLAAVPDMTDRQNEGRYYKRYYKCYYSTSQQQPKKAATAGTGKAAPMLIGSGISFAASEAYKMLRTKIQYSFTDEKKCHIVAVSSAMAGEGKSVSSANLANTLAQFGERVLLIDCDMRRPTVAEKLKLLKGPGLSDYLTDSLDVQDLLQRYSSRAEDNLFYVLTAGPTPPNPMELLSSAKMARLLEKLTDLFDYIILDAPPIGEVSDALTAARLADGVLLVVRQDYCNSIALKDALRQFEFVGSKILGVLFNCAYGDNSGKYKYKKYYKKYGHRYYGRRGYGYG